MLDVLRMENCLMCVAECLRCMYWATFICGYMVIFIFIINDFMKTCPCFIPLSKDKNKLYYFHISAFGRRFLSDAALHSGYTLNLFLHSLGM